MKLTDLEQGLVEAVVKAKIKHSEANGFKKVKRDTRSHHEIMTQGLAAELMVCKYLNCYPDIDEQYSKVDIVWNGKTINVKSTHYPNGRLLIPDYQGITADIYILAIGTMPEFKIIGWASAENIFRKENLMDLGYGLSYGLEQSQLTPMEELC